MWAAAYGQAPTVSLLLRHGADINAHGQEQETALHLAAARGHHDVARILVSSGAVVDAKDENRSEIIGLFDGLINNLKGWALNSETCYIIMWDNSNL